MNTARSIESTFKRESKLAIGTVQFGLPYGVSNRKGQPGKDEVERILSFAKDIGISLLDTAPAYGQSENVLGDVLGTDSAFQIVTKTCALRGESGKADAVSAVRRTFEVSLSRLRRDRLYGLIVHLAEDLLGPLGDDIWRVLEKFKSDQNVEKIGTSCYSGDNLREIIRRYPLDLVQLPFNVFDQKLMHGGLLDELKKSGVEIHARSVFLQGLALMDPDKLPDGFKSAQAPLKAFRQLAKSADLSPLELALRFVSSLDSIDRLVIGVTDMEELRQIASAVSGDIPKSLDMDSLATGNEAITNPSLWPPDNQQSWAFDFSLNESGPES